MNPFNRTRYTTPPADARTLARREKQRIARSKRETPEEYAARVLRELEDMQERQGEFDQ